MKNERKDSIDKLEEILKNFTLKKNLTQQKLMKFYGYMEGMFDKDLQNVEDSLLREIENDNKQEDFLEIKKILEERM